ncbi:hypothetical protein ACIRNI_22870 [Streptomyces sp. NPDC093546]
MIPQLILAGHTPEEAEKHAAQIPAYRDALGGAASQHPRLTPAEGRR